MYKDEYQAAMEKISASDAWKQRTLAAMRAAQMGQARESATSAENAQPEAPRHAPNLRRAPRWALAAAAVVLALALPVIVFRAPKLRLTAQVGSSQLAGALSPEAQLAEAPSTADCALQDTPAAAATDAFEAATEDVAVADESLRGRTGAATQSSVPARQAEAAQNAENGTAQLCGVAQSWSGDSLALLLDDGTVRRLVCPAALWQEDAAGARVCAMLDADGAVTALEILPTPQ